MTTPKYTQRLVLEPDNTHRLANLCGRLNEHLVQIEKSLAVKIQNRGNEFKLTGSKQAVESGNFVLNKLYESTADKQVLSPEAVHLLSLIHI